MAGITGIQVIGRQVERDLHMKTLPWWKIHRIIAREPGRRKIISISRYNKPKPEKSLHYPSIPAANTYIYPQTLEFSGIVILAAPLSGRAAA